MPRDFIPLSEPGSSVNPIEPDAVAKGPEDGTTLFLPDGVSRAMLFHLGALWRLKQSGVLPKLKRVSSVSGGSITAGVLGLRGERRFEREQATNFGELAAKTIDSKSILGGIFLPVGIGKRVAKACRDVLFGEGGISYAFRSESGNATVRTERRQT